MPRMPAPLPVEEIEPRILSVRGRKVILDMDLARLYGVTTKRLNEQVKRNRDRFPEDFRFALTAGEKAEVVAICDHLHALRFYRRYNMSDFEFQDSADSPRRPHRRQSGCLGEMWKIFIGICMAILILIVLYLLYNRR